MTYATRSSAIRAAKNACRKALGPVFEAYEGHDFIIHCEFDFANTFRNRFKFDLVGPAKSGGG